MTRLDECVKVQRKGFRGFFKPHKKYCNNNCNEDCKWRKNGKKKT